MPDQISGTELAEPAADDATGAAVVRAKQLWLFPPPKPLNERFGAEFFRAIPKVPGVYFFRDEAGKLIYVGKAKNLRQRLCSYRYVHPDRDSRKTWRLVNRVRQIDWETCADHKSALLEESQLLRKHRPQFNRANVWPWAAVYLGLKVEGDRVRLKVSRDLTGDFEWYGAFKSFSIYAFSAFLRLIHRRYADRQAPLNWFAWDRAREFEVDSGRISVPALREFLSGESKELLCNFEREAEIVGTGPLANQNLVLNDLILLEEFYERGPMRNRQINAGASRSSGQITPEELVDWLAVQSA